MSLQPIDISQCTFDALKFQNLDRTVANTTTILTPVHERLEDSDPTFLARKESVEASTEYQQLYFESTVGYPVTNAVSGDLFEELFPGSDLGMVEPYPNATDHEEIVTTVTPDANQYGVDLPSDEQLDFSFNEFLHLTPEETQSFLQQLQDEYDLETIDQSIEQRTMFTKVEPPVSLRPRYESDGTRQVEKSRTEPMVVGLPSLTDIKLSPGQSFRLRLILTTDGVDPVCLHPNKLEYHADDAEQLSDGTVCVLLTSDDRRQGEKILSRLSNIKTKLAAYHRHMTQVNLQGPANNERVGDTLTVAEAKDVFAKFNLQASRIVCQLVIKQNNTYRFTDIVCQTNALEEKKPVGKKKKRPAEVYENDDERPSTSKAVKRKKRSNN